MTFILVFKYFMIVLKYRFNLKYQLRLKRATEESWFGVVVCQQFFSPLTEPERYDHKIHSASRTNFYV